MPVLRLASVVISAAISLSACSPDQTSQSAPLTDDFGDTIVVRGAPKRIVSLNPATTEIAFAIGAGNRLVGRTHWDLYPPEAKNVPDLGSGIRPNVEAVLERVPISCCFTRASTTVQPQRGFV